MAKEPTKAPNVEKPKPPPLKSRKQTFHTVCPNCGQYLILERP